MSDMQIDSMVTITGAEYEALRAQNAELVAALEIMSMMGGYTKLHPDETASSVEQNTYSWGVTEGYKEMAAMARAALAKVEGK